ncbi:sensor histidine kinase [Anaeromyxobacter sp. Fw109-5]|uniref:sensor histidine kinase n=1 Tax=Anaeromyxobacter sp. (strain Fw109-5) TaxID=404589 RepID=UPI0000ED77E9|nr:ATP-binding protein [Anaeromyxobacter sp. Fw109-5]ABS24896.1 integral membrane sensor signal transduction histidine kinase [Anaeromyxobacter sp. Fw109-5]
MGRGVRTVLLLDLAAAGAGAAAVTLAIGLPLAARGGLSPRALAVVVLVGGAAGVALGAALLFRAVARPVDRIVSAAERLGAGARADALPLLAPPGDAATERRGAAGAAVAFERLAGALSEERSRLAEKVSELERANGALLEARESLVRAERLATAGQLASGIAHEVGNPLGAITGYAELARSRLRDGSPPALAQAAEFAERIAAETARIDRIVRDLLDLARPSAPVVRPIDVRGPLEAALRLARAQPRFRAVEVTEDLPAALPRALADEQRLAQVLLNLLLNAGDAMGGAGAARVRARAAGGFVELAVEDAGPGFDTADLSRVFEPFFTTKGAGQGTGLGLAICRSIVEALGGDIRAENAPGGGARVVVRLVKAGEPAEA